MEYQWPRSTANATVHNSPTKRIPRMQTSDHRGLVRRSKPLKFRTLVVQPPWHSMAIGPCLGSPGSFLCTLACRRRSRSSPVAWEKTPLEEEDDYDDDDRHN